ncbi:hypothetical protein D3C76_1277840 [compost metagenome]
MLESIVDGHRKGWMGLLGEVMHGCGHTVKEERLRLVLATMSVRGGDQLLSLRYCQGGIQIRENRPQYTAQPDIEKVREIGVADIVVVGWICGDKFV